MKTLSEEGRKCIVIIDEGGRLIGTLSDGDLRKAILNGASMKDNIDNIYQKSPRVLIDGKYKKSEARKIFFENNFDLIPVINDKGFINDILFLESVLDQEEKTKKINYNIPVVIMAGGRGTRLEPFTKVLPKPLIPIHEKPIVEHIIDRFLKIGSKHFYLSVNYKSKILKAYFEELKPKYKISFVEEKFPLGTAGSLNLLENKIRGPFFVTNCDIIIKADLDSLFKFHQKTSMTLH